MAPSSLRLPPTSPFLFSMKVGDDRLLRRATPSTSPTPGLPQQATTPLATSVTPSRARELFLALRHEASRARRWPTIAAAAADVTDSFLAMGSGSRAPGLPQ